MSIPMSSMSEEKIAEFLAEQRFAVVGTNRRDGPPQLTPVWYLHENGKIYISVLLNGAKARNLRRDPRIALCIAGSCPDARSVMVYGEVEFMDGSEARAQDINWKITRRYYESDEAALEYFKQATDNFVIVTITPARILAEDYNN